MRKILFSLLTICAVQGSRAQSVNIKFTEYDLPNGLHVILHEDHTVPTVAISVLYHVGSKNEDPTRTGFAHFFEHLLFEGSENIGRGEYMKLIQNNGGVINANTSFDRTFYFETLPSNKLEQGLWMESERMLHAKIDDIGLETQRKVVKEEKKQRYENTPYGHLLEQIFKNAYTKHPYQWTPIGEAQYIDQATLPEFIDFYKTFYVPNNATLSIGGDLNIAQTKAWVEKYFSTIPKGTKPIPRPSIVEPAQTAEKRVTYLDKVQLPAVVFAYHTPAQGTPEAYALEMVAKILSEGKSSRLQKQVVDKEQKAVAAGAFNLPSEDPGLAMMFGIGNMGVTPEALEKSMNDEIEKLLSNGITEDELAKCKNQIEKDFVNQNQRVLGIVENLANYHVYYGNANLINTELERYMKVTTADMIAAAKKYFTKNNRLVLYYLPDSSKG
ncbi:MAG: insulinase family protein [Bacteroidetes bacterium]|jgi:zinc protease|nr:insulinase family protein [Bacteroidota bacterium]HMT35571.1 pitrilysin family protein [Chitinophagaceae bacterium]MBK7039121.1 insulinase family protein [Bacteroidota bacterium]MBK7587641.1 insulinase family protein [Bacteroidota bacterium]MBK9300832.1 insulinase family protein [Bacteroidota bacterium]